MGFADVEVMLFQSKFGAAGTLRVHSLGLREFYRDARLTRSLVAPSPADGPTRRSACRRGAAAAPAAWTRLWDLFGPAGAGRLRTSRYAVGSASGDGSARAS